MKALTLHQPWATLMALAGHQDPAIRKLGKKIETRSWWTGYRGPLMITASKQWDRIEAEWVLYGKDKAATAIRETLKAAGYGSLGELPLGAALCVGNLVNCIRFTNGWCPPAPECFFGNYATGRYGFVTEDMKALKPIPVRGMQGLWTPAPDVLEAVMAQLKGVA